MRNLSALSDPAMKEWPEHIWPREERRSLWQWFKNEVLGELHRGNKEAK